MTKKLSKNKWIMVTITTFILLFLTWFCWMSMVTKKTTWMENKVKAGLKISIQAVERDAPRIKLTNNGGFYVPDTNGNLQSNHPINSSWQEAYQVLLASLNQDESIPLIKISYVSLDTDYTSVIDAHTAVQFEVLPGMTKTIVVMESMSLPHFKDSTGNDVVQ